tara:strand:- start:2074 stop:3135 length:1062 start_codon:yes stop_codon:yes gene_type:complete
MILKKLFYRAMPIGLDKISYGNYITMSRRFAIDHAITSSIYHGEDYGVYSFYLNKNEFKPANNPGEYLYAGASKDVFLYGTAKYDDFSANSDFKISKNKLKSLYSWLKLSGFKKESKRLAFLITKQSSGPLFSAEHMIDKETYPYYEDSGHYPDIEDEIRKEDIFYGKNVLWIGTPGKMLRVDADYIYPIQGNIFYPEKINDVMNKIVNAEERVTLYAPYGNVTKIEINDIRESLDYEDDYGMRTLTTGDEELDEYLKDPDEFFSHLDLEEEGDRAEYEKEKARLDEELSEATASGDGDLGEYMVQIRDGNHRAFGAVAAGETYIWVAISENQLQDIRSDIHSSSNDLKKKIV